MAHLNLTQHMSIFESMMDSVYPVAPYRAAWDDVGDPFVADMLAALEALLDQRPEDPRAPLPMLPLKPVVALVSAKAIF